MVVVLVSKTSLKMACGSRQISRTMTDLSLSLSLYCIAANITLKKEKKMSIAISGVNIGPA